MGLNCKNLSQKKINMKDAAIETGTSAEHNAKKDGFSKFA